MKRFARSFWLLVLATVVLSPAGCGGMRTTRFVNPNFNFSFVERVAVIPLENLSEDAQAGERATRLLITELLASGAVDVVGPGETNAALLRVGGATLTPTREQISAVGEALGAQALLIGNVAQSDTLRSGAVSIPVVTLDVHMVETETGTTVWAATHSEKSAGVSAKIFGTGAEPISVTTRRCARRIVEALLR